MKKAFTLAEILITLTIIGVIGVVMLYSITHQDFDARENLLKIHKAMRLIDEASVQMSQNEPVQLPAGAFMVNTTGSWEYAVCKDSGCNNMANSEDIRNLFGRYIRFEETTGDFGANYTGFNTNSNNIQGGKIAGDIFIGFQVIQENNHIGNCPEIRVPSFESNEDGTVQAPTIITPQGKCWGRAFIDTNGRKGPNTLGQDYFEFGLSELGIAK